jgi:hypothetical protein
MRKLDAKLGRIPIVEDEPDAMLARASQLGTEHEAGALAKFHIDFPLVGQMTTNSRRGSTTRPAYPG